MLCDLCQPLASDPAAHLSKLHLTTQKIELHKLMHSYTSWSPEEWQELGALVYT